MNGPLDSCSHLRTGDASPYVQERQIMPSSRTPTDVEICRIDSRFVPFSYVCTRLDVMSSTLVTALSLSRLVRKLLSGISFGARPARGTFKFSHASMRQSPATGNLSTHIHELCPPVQHARWTMHLPYLLVNVMLSMAISHKDLENSGFAVPLVPPNWQLYSTRRTP